MIVRTPVAVVFTVALICSCQQASGARDSKHAGPACVAGFCFGVGSIGVLMEESELVKKYGPGYWEVKKFPLHCYILQDQKLFVRVRPYHGEQKQIMEIFISDVPNCKSALPPARAFPRATTGEGLAIGDPFDRVLRLYGKPAMEGNPIRLGYCLQRKTAATEACRYGDLVYRYLRKDDQLFHADIVLRAGKVAGILISIYP